MIYMYAYQVVTNCFQQQGCYYRTVDTTGKGQQYFSVADLTAYQFNLVVHKVSHVPISFGLARFENERLNRCFDGFDIIRELWQFHCTSCFVVTGSYHRDSCLVDGRIYIDGNTVYYVARSTINNNTLYVGQFFQFFNGYIMRIDLTIYT